ncbi:MAG: Mfa1 family fimbria major subunit [Bacteroides sp.]|nr:Mfa1 family fimbria major subunit [Bacteroides sp.]
MKIKSFIALFAAGLLTASCSNDKNETPVIPTHEKAVVRVTVDAASFSTRVTFPGNTPTSQEVPLYNYAILVFNENQILEYIEPVSIYTAQDQTILDPTQTPITSEFEVTLGTKYFYVVANVPVSELMSNQDQFSPDQNVLVQGIKEYVLELDEVDQIIGYLKSDTQANPNPKNRGFMMTTLGGLTTVRIHVHKDDGTNTVKLTLGRAMAKVAVRNALKTSTQDQLYGTLENMEYKVGHNPKKMYVVQHYHRDASDVLITPNYEDDKVDPNAYFGSLEDYQSAEDGSNTYTYCLENANKIPKHGNASVVYIKGKFIPHDQYILDGTSSDLVNGTFWRIKNTDPNDPIKYTEGFYANQPSVASNQEAVEYKNGICYYTLYLEDEDAIDDKYTVKRNSFYKVSITKVSNAGEPSDDEEELIPEPETPLDGSGLVEATITLIPWDEIEQDGEI